MKLTWVGWINMLVMQWLGCRIMVGISNGKVTKVGLLGPVVPLTGWWNDYWGWDKRLWLWSAKPAEKE